MTNDTTLLLFSISTATMSFLIEMQLEFLFIFILCREPSKLELKGAHINRALTVNVYYIFLYDYDVSEMDFYVFVALL